MQKQSLRTEVTGPSGDGKAMGYIGLLRHYPYFRWLWLGDVTSFLGDWFNTIALYTAVQALSSDARAIAAVMVAKMLPPFLIIPIVGPLIDRFDRRRLLIITDLIRTLCALGLIISYRADSLIGLYGCTVLLMAGSGLALPAKNAILPMIVRTEHLPAANAFSGGTWSTMLALGATLGGIATALFGISVSFGIDAITFAVSAWCFSNLPALPAPGQSKAGARFIDGLRYLKSAPYIAALSSLKPMLGLLGGVLVLIPMIGSGVFPDHAGPFYVGMVFAARGFGAAVGALWLRTAIGDEPAALRVSIAGGFLVAGISYALLSVTTSLWQAALCFLVAAIGSSAVWVFSGTLLQLEGDKRFHGRIFSIEFGSMTLVIAGSSWISGSLVESGFTVFEVARFGASLAVVPFVLWTGVVILKGRSG